MFEISLEFRKGAPDIGKISKIRIESIVQEYRMKLYDMLETFRPRMEQIAIEETINAGKVVTSQLVDSYDAVLNQTANEMTLRLVNDARDPDWDVYYWQVINDGRRPNSKPPPISRMMKYITDTGSKTQRRGVSGRFIKSGGSEKQYGLLAQAIATAKSIGIHGIKARPEIFTKMRNRIYQELRAMLTSRLGEING